MRSTPPFSPQVPRTPVQTFQFAVALHQQGRLQEAERFYRAVLKADRNHVDSLHNLGRICLHLGRVDEAIKLIRRAVQRHPNSAQANCDLGVALCASGRHQEAIQCFERALALKPNFADAESNLATALQAKGQAAEAIVHFEKAVALHPDLAEAHNNLGFALLALDRRKEGIKHLERAVALKPHFAQAHNNLGLALSALNRTEEAIVSYERALTVDPDYAEAYTNMGIALRELGHLSEARQTFEKAVALFPRNATAYHGLAELKHFTIKDPDFRAMEELARDVGSLCRQQQIRLHFALGKAYADVGQHEFSFHHLLRGNALQRQEVVYDETKTLGVFDRTRAVFTPELMCRKQGSGDPSSLPIFIIGMPRSGTTLIEQILASHPKIFGAGEVAHFERTVRTLGDSDDFLSFYPETLTTLPEERLRSLGSTYVAALTASAPSAERITDKMPTNFVFAGLIHLALTKAHIIHVRRNPVDTCLSCFSKLFTFGNAHTFDLGELGRYYRGYAELMEHWRSVLPPGAMLEVDYEDIVADLEAQARRIIAYCDLPWDDACLTFYETQRTVRTASATQVRQPVYRSAVGRWKPYQHLLQPLLDELGDKLTGA